LTEAATQYNRISELVNDSVRDDDLLTALESFIDVYKQERQRKETPRIPLSLFSDRKLGILQVATKYLKENLSLNYSKIARLVNRNDRTIWTTYKKAKEKQKEKFIQKEDKHIIPCNIFSDRKLGPLEALTIYLKDELRLSFKDISHLLNRNYRTIWLSYHNGMRKREKHE
jgi:hypothetical protein